MWVWPWWWRGLHDLQACVALLLCCKPGHRCGHASAIPIHPIQGGGVLRCAMYLCCVERHFGMSLDSAVAGVIVCCMACFCPFTCLWRRVGELLQWLWRDSTGV